MLKTTIFVAILFPLISFAQQKPVKKEVKEAPAGKEALILSPSDQQVDIVREEKNIYSFVEIMPKFPGGEQALVKFIQENLKYPATAIDNSIEGRSVISFVIDKEGKLSDFSVMKKLGWGCDEAAIEVLKKMPAWEPGMQNGKKVNVKYLLPFSFKLTDYTPKPPAILEKAEVMPSFPGGDKELDKFISKNLKYPKAAKKAKIKGAVVVSFVVDADGKIKDPAVVKSLSPECDAEALRLVSLMNVWTPGEQGGKKVAVRYRQPFRFGN